MRQTNLGGHGLQLWEVTRLYVELYDAVPLATPREVWGPHVLSYTLPRSRLGACLEGSLTLATPAYDLPAGFEVAALPGAPVRSLLTGFDRVAQVVAVLPGGDEWVIYTGILGPPKAAEPRVWQIPLIALDASEMQGWLPTPPYSGPPTPTGRRAISSTARLYAHDGPRPLDTSYWTSGEYSTPATTLEQWWKAAIADDPMSEYGVGPDRAFLAGTPLGARATAATYRLDSRAFSLRSSGREVPPYLTHLRAVVDNHVIASDTIRQGNLPAFTPVRTATYGGASSRDTHTESSQFGLGGGGRLEVGPLQTQHVTLSGSMGPAEEGQLRTGVEASLDLSIDDVRGVAAVAFEARASTSSETRTIVATRYLATEGSYTLKVEVPADMAQAVTHLDIAVGLISLEGNSTSGASGNVSTGTGNITFEVTNSGVTFEKRPPGLDYPVLTAESWEFSLPGVHAGPLLVTGLPEGEQWASTVIQVDGGGLSTAVRCGPLPYQSSPLSGGRWTG